MAAGAVGLASTTITDATFTVDDAQETTTATFTTAERHSFQVGQPVRLGDDPTMQASLCVDSALSKDGFQCIGGDLLSYHPITAVTKTSFSVDLGVLVTARRGVGQAVTPAPWHAGCATCGVTAEAVSTGVVVAWTAPTMSLHVATFAVRGGDTPFRLLDARPVGRLYNPPADPEAPQREAFGVVVDDFASGGPAEIAVAWGAECEQADPTMVHVPCGRLTFLGMDGAQRFTQLSTNTWGEDPWCTGPGAPDEAVHRGPFALDITSGHFRSGRSTSPGADLALAWVATTPPAAGATGTGEVSHVVQTFDVTPQLGLAPSLPLQKSDTSDQGPCATVLARHGSVTAAGTGGAYPLRSNVQVAAADLDGNNGDEVVVAETMPDLAGGTLQNLELSPVSVSVWNQETADGVGDGWRPVARRQPSVPGWTQPFTAPAGGTTPVPVDAGYLAVGEGGSGQVSLAVGRLARRQTSATDTLAYPNGINPDVVLGWTCQSKETCGTDAGGDSVATDALAVVSDGLGGMSLTRQSGRTLSSRPADVPRDPNLSPALLEPQLRPGAGHRRQRRQLDAG